MSEIDEKEIEHRFKVVSQFKPGPEVTARDLERVREYLTSQISKPKTTPQKLWRIIMKSQKTKFATAATIILAVVLTITMLNHSAQPVWAIEQTIEALSQFNALRFKATCLVDGTEHYCEVWTTANKGRTQTDNLVLRVDTGVVLWVDEGKTYTYDPASNTVLFENACTAGFSTWFGPKMFELFSAITDKRIILGKDPATGRERVILIVSMVDSNGPQSWQFEFDADTKLPVSFSHWPDRERRGKASFSCHEITYFEDAPDHVFDIDIPANAAFKEKEIVIPEYNLELLSDPECGISAEGMSQSQACQKILEQIWQAVIDEDLAMVRKLCPSTKVMNDEFLKVVLLGVDEDDKVVEVLQIGEVTKTGLSRLGPLAVVPNIVRCKDGKKQEVKIIIQFRNISGESSCVIHGPYGLPVTIE